MVIQIVTLFPEMFSGVLHASMLKRAQERGLVDLRVVPLRRFGMGIHHMTDDYPFGGNVGMLLRADVVVPAVEWAMMHCATPAKILFTSAQGRVLKQAMAETWVQEFDHVIVVAGHYEGIDDRAREILKAEEISIGDYILTGGELPAMIIADAVTRLIPGVLGADSGAVDDSFSGGRSGLEGPQYTRPRQYRGQEVPSVLLSGDHRKISEWRDDVRLQWTRNRRPDLLEPPDRNKRDGE